MLGKNTILKAIHNWDSIIAFFVKVWMLGKNTILKAIHNDNGSKVHIYIGVNAG